MKIFNQLGAWLLVLSAAGFVFGQDVKGKPNDGKASRVILKYDKGKDITTVRLKQFSISRLAQEKDQAPNFPLHQMDLEAAFQFKGQGTGMPVDGIDLRFRAIAGNYVFLRGLQVTAILDRDAEGEDRAIPLGMTDYKSYPPKFNSVYEELMTLRVPAEALSKLAKANSVEFYLGPIGYRLTDIQVQAIRDLAGYLPNSEVSH